MRRGPSAVNALIAVNKPLGLTSHDVVSRVRRAVGEKRVGHAGTRDPAASGVLVVGIGQATKLLGLLTLDEKSYTAKIAFGAQTDTDDAEGSVIAEGPVPACLRDETFAREALLDLVGEQDQVPPAYSAISVGGKRAYAMAREGRKVELQSRRVTIRHAELLGIEVTGPASAGERPTVVWECAFEVSKGTYIRSIARDLGIKLGTFAHLCGLERTSSGGVSLDSCIDLDALMAAGEKGSAQELIEDRCLDPVAALGLPVREVRLEEIPDITCGRRIPAGMTREGQVPSYGDRVALVWDGALVGIWECRAGELACASNFPQAILGVR